MASEPFRVATSDDAQRLLELERAASLAALPHVFPPDEYPYPSAEVLARWTAVLDAHDMTVLVLDDPETPPALLTFVAFDSDRIHHLAVHPDHWRRGLARRALDVATATMARPHLWVLVANHRARAFYERLGWRPTGRQQAGEYPPHPEELELTLGG